MRSMKRYIVRRALEAIPLIFAVIIFNFVILHLAPGDPTALLLVGAGAAKVDPKFIEAIRKRYGLDRPLLDQLAIYIKGVLRGDLGYSFFRSKSVTLIILEKSPATLLLTLTSAFAAIIVGTLVGTHSAKKMGSKLDASIEMVSSIMYSVPVFWAGLLLLIFFSFYLRWFPSSGMVSPTGEQSGSIPDILQHLFLPFISLFISQVPIFIRTTRSSVIEMMREDFITTFRAVGLSENAVIYKHALRNALLPTVTIAGMLIGFVLTGALLTETLFGWPGLGRTMYEAITMRDYPLIMGIFIFTSMVVIVATLMVDILYVALDPRIKYK